eukprot:CAMPEP_0194214988 /NCGR_PEP_ID=MMETSP0156-20130528/16458_1 /TAXON_ID=33649 /ORGANISM="Thalassionema nitzschioides, Strain L26-B" /LENGTH=274 /DNA_ID=CAMNT_0038943383 /DNA_START=132 /DNA_END=957 /DNA_ORIENTATION=-
MAYITASSINISLSVEVNNHDKAVENNDLLVMQYSNTGSTSGDNDQESLRRISSKLKTKISSFSKKIPTVQEKTEDQKRIEEYLEYIRSRENRLKNARGHSSTERKKPKDFFVTKPKDYMSAAFKEKSVNKEEKQTDYNSQYMQYIGHRRDRLHTDDYSFVKSQWYNSRGPVKEDPRPSNQEPIPTHISLEVNAEKEADGRPINGLFGRSSKMSSLLCRMKRKKTLDQAVKKTRLQVFKRVNKITIAMLTTALFLRTAVTAIFAIGLKLGVILA